MLVSGGDRADPRTSSHGGTTRRCAPDHGAGANDDRGEGFEKMLRGEFARRALNCFHGEQGMAIEVAKIELKNVQTRAVSGNASRLTIHRRRGHRRGRQDRRRRVNDFTRILADQAFRRVLLKLGTRGEADIGQIPMVWSAAATALHHAPCDGFARNAKTRVLPPGSPSATRRARNCFRRHHNPPWSRRRGRGEGGDDRRHI